MVAATGQLVLNLFLLKRRCDATLFRLRFACTSRREYPCILSPATKFEIDETQHRASRYVDTVTRCAKGPSMVPYTNYVRLITVYGEELRLIFSALRKRIEIWHAQLRNPSFRLRNTFRSSKAKVIEERRYSIDVPLRRRRGRNKKNIDCIAGS